MFDAFISYSRKNTDFARRLIEQLQEQDKIAWVDWEGIPLSAPNWWLEIKAGIEAADNFVFIVTPDSMESVVCNMELDYAFELKKRIIPIIYQEIESRETFASVADYTPDDAMRERLSGKNPLIISQSNWQRLSHINWMFFRESDDFDKSFELLITTVDTDLEYVKAHTRILVRAKIWEDKNKNTSFLLRGDELSDAEQWLANSIGKTQEATDLHRDYILKSRTYENERIANLARLERSTRQFRIASLVLAFMIVATLIVTVLAINQSVIANNQRDEAYTVGSQVAGEATLFALQQGRIVTLVAGNVSIAMSDLEQTPEAFIGTVTAIAVLNAWQLQSAEHDGVEMVLVPAGCFWMGSIIRPDEQPIHEVCFEEAFWIDRYEVSNEQFNRLGGQADNLSDWALAEQPRTSISWLEASAYCAIRDAQLPTEAQWEYAARGTNSLQYPWANDFDEALSHHGQGGDGEPLGIDTSLGGESWVGAEHMSGNVAEWVQDIYTNTYDEDTSGIQEGNRVYRGGTYIDVGDEHILSTTDRARADQMDSLPFIGFRCVKVID